jgi:hypothetical protein
MNLIGFQKNYLIWRPYNKVQKGKNHHIHLYMSIKIKRIQSLESGDFNSYNNGRLRAHIEVPSSVGFTDLENSQLVFRMNTVIAGNDASAGNLIPSFIAGRQGGDVNKPLDVGGAGALIRNSRVTSREYGLLNEQRDQNVVTANLDYYTKYTSESGAWMNFDGGCAQKTHDPNQMYQARDSLFLDARKPEAVGVVIQQSNNNQKSQQVSAEVRVPMKCIDRFADGNRQFPNMAVGNLTYRIEFEPQPGRAVTALGVDSKAYQCEDATVSATQPGVGTLENPIFYRLRKGDRASKLGEDNAGMQPFYLGMPVKASYKANGVAANVVTYIESLEIITTDATTIAAGTDGSLKIVLADPGVATAADAITDLTLQMHCGSATVDWNIEEIFLELHCLQLAPQQLEAVSRAMESLEIPYTEHRLVKKVLNQTSDYSEMIQTDPGCAGLAVLTPKNNQLVSSIDHARRYRFSIEGKFTTNRDVQIQSLINSDGQALGRQLHNHLMQKFYGNLGKQLLRFDSPGKFYDFSATDAEVEDQTHTFYPLVTPLVPNDSIINFQLQADVNENMDTKEIYYLAMYPRTLNFRNGRLVV